MTIRCGRKFLITTEAFWHDKNVVLANRIESIIWVSSKSFLLKKSDQASNSPRISLVYVPQLSLRVLFYFLFQDQGEWANVLLTQLNLHSLGQTVFSLMVYFLRLYLVIALGHTRPVLDFSHGDPNRVLFSLLMCVKLPPHLLANLSCVCFVRMDKSGDDWKT